MNEIPETRPSLLVRMQNPRDDRAWVEFAAIYEPLVYRLARRKGFQDADARELVQEVFVAVASAIDRWDPDPAKGKFRGWLFRIARNLMINLLIRRERGPRASGDSDVKRLLDEQPAPDGEVSAFFDRQYRRETFHWAARQVRPQFQQNTWEAFRLTAIEGIPVDETAATLGITPGAVYIARSRVMARLRETIQRLEGE
jgi:RNA polymerase sigma-70 factor (ECF subfamily)